MQAQPFLTLFQNLYSFERANHIFAQQNLKHCWKHWLTAEMVYALGQNPSTSNIEIDSLYQTKGVNIVSPDNSQDRKTEESAYLSYKAGDEKAKIVDKRSASKSDFSFKFDKQTVFVEVRCSHMPVFFQAKEFRKFTDDIQRVQALKKANGSSAIITVFALYGRFENKDMKKLEPLDNNTCCSYVLDSGLSGSTSIARLSHMQREGEPRTLIMAHSA